MAVRIVNELLHDDNFNKKMDDYWNKLNKDYRDKKYKDLDRQDQSINGKNGISAVDHETGKFILNSVDHYLDSLDYKIQYDFDDSDEGLTNVANNAFFGKGEEDEKYNGFERATKQIKRHLSFKDPKNGKDGDYKIELLIEVRVRSVVSEVGNVDDSDYKQSKCKVLVLSNIKSLPFEDLKKEYNEVISLIMKSIKMMKKEKYWDLEEQNTFSLEDIKYIKPKEQNQEIKTNNIKTKGKPKRVRTKQTNNKRKSKIR